MRLFFTKRLATAEPCTEGLPRRGLRWLGRLAVALGLLWLVAVWLLPVVAERLLVRQLRAQGIHVQLRVNRLTPWRTELSSVHLGVGPDSSWIAELAVDYTPGGLLQGQVDRITVDNAVLTLRQTAAGWILPGGADRLSSSALPSGESTGSGSLPHAGPSRSGHSVAGNTPPTRQMTNPAGGALPVAELLLRNVTLRLLSDTGESRVRGHATLQLPDWRLIRFDATLKVADGTVRTHGTINLVGKSGTALVEATHVQAGQLWAAAAAFGVLPKLVVADTTLAGSISGRQYLQWRDGQLRQNDGAWAVTAFTLQRAPDVSLTAANIAATVKNDAWTLDASGTDVAIRTLPPLAGIALKASGKLQHDPDWGTTAAVSIQVPEWHGAVRGARQEIGPGKLTANLSIAAGDASALAASADWRAALPCNVQYGEFKVTAASEVSGTLQLKGGKLSTEATIALRQGHVATPGATGGFDTLTVQAHLADLDLVKLRTLPPGSSAAANPPAIIAGSLTLTNGTLTHHCGVRASGIDLTLPFRLVPAPAGGWDVAAGVKEAPARFSCGDAVWRGVLYGAPQTVGPGKVSATFTFGAGAAEDFTASGQWEAALPCDVRHGEFQLATVGELSGALSVQQRALSGETSILLRQGRIAAPGATGEFDTLTVQAQVANVDLTLPQTPPPAESAAVSRAGSVVGSLRLTNGSARHTCGVRAAGLELATPFRLSPAAAGWNLTVGAEKEPGRLTCGEAAWRALALDGFGLAWTPAANGVHLTGKGQVRQSAVAFTCAGELAWAPELSAQVELRVPQARLTQADPLLASLAPIPAGIEFSADVGGRVTAQIKGTQPPLLSGQVTVAKGELAQAAKKLVVHGITSTVEIEDLLAGRSAPGQELTLEKAELANLNLGPAKLKFRVENPTSLFLEQADIGWANGNIRGYAFRFNPLRPEGEVTLYADRIDIQGVLGLLKNFHGNAAGVLYGRLPLRIRNGAVNLSEGFLFSPPGQAGQLRMTETGWLPAALTQSGLPDQAVQRVNAALGDFEFSIFRLDLETTSAKEALLRLRLVGGARQDKTSPPVDLNINVRGPLQGLLNLGLQFTR